LYDKKYSPKYTLAFSVNAVMAGIAVLGCLALRWCLKRENAKMDREEGEDTEQQASPRIRYVL